jgi:two-component system, cell cycle sensor histidine kinase and response regulator CckA
MAAARAGELTRQLLLFSRQQLVAPRFLDLNHIITDMDKMLRRILGEDIDFVTVQGEDLGDVLADPSHLDQVLMNLVVNARDAMPTGGRLTIETANVELHEEYETVHLGHCIQPGAYVMLAVTDTGHGMDQATQARIFEPFFTTKEMGKGTGLGLSTVFGIVQQARGYVWVFSEVGRGTTFKIYLPRVEGAANHEERPRNAPTQPGTETILLVEDQENVRAAALSILQRGGYKVLVARSPEEALVLCNQYQDQIDLLLTDVVMPKLSGSELAQRVTAVRPDVKVLYMSGYTDDSALRHGVLEGEMAFLHKPFTVQSLRQRVRSVIEGDERSR